MTSLQNIKQYMHTHALPGHKMTSARYPHLRCQNVCVCICPLMWLKSPDTKGIHFGTILKVCTIIIHIFTVPQNHKRLTRMWMKEKCCYKLKPSSHNIIITSTAVVIELSALNEIRAIPTIKFSKLYKMLLQTAIRLTYISTTVSVEVRYSQS